MLILSIYFLLSVIDRRYSWYNVKFLSMYRHFSPEISKIFPLIVKRKFSIIANQLYHHFCSG